MLNTDAEVQTAGSSNICEVSIEKIKPNPNQPRRDFDDDSLQELANSIRQIGIIQPITLRDMGDDTYIIIAGERRWRASQRAGLTHIPAYIRTVDDENMMEMALVENIQRQDLSALEIALAYQHLMEQYDLTQEQLSRTLFPLGSLTKAEVREIAETQGLVTAKKRESQDICFVPGGDYASFICGYTGHEYPQGDFVSTDGKVMGTHKGIINYTIGQRKGLGLALKKPAYVLDIDTERNRVVLGDNEELFTRELTAGDFNWVSTAAPQGEIKAEARIRYRHHEAPARVVPLSEDTVRIVFDEPQRAITRGQSVVVYDGDYVIGGGIIL